MIRQETRKSRYEWVCVGGKLHEKLFSDKKMGEKN